MSVFDDVWWALTHPFSKPGILGGEYDIPGTPSGVELGIGALPTPGTDDTANVVAARKQLAYLLGGTLVVVGAPAIYAYSLGSKKKRKLTDKELVLGQTLENASSQATGLLQTLIASPPIATAAAYILVQKAEDAQYIVRGLGNAAQGLLTVQAAGPMIQGIGSIVGSAFKKGK